MQAPYRLFARGVHEIGTLFRSVVRGPAGRGTITHMSTPITIVDVAPRDGLQSDGAVVSTEAKVELISRIAAAGIRRIEATSFVNPARVPQMADADELMAALLERRRNGASDDPLRDVSLIGLVLNRRGLDRALAAGCDEVNAVVVVSDTFSQKNQGTDTDTGIEVWEQIAASAADAGVPASVTLAASFGCPYEGEVDLRPPHRRRGALRSGRRSGDRAGRLDRCRSAHRRRAAHRRGRAPRSPHAGTDQRLRVHFHNTRNTGIANVAAAVEAGVHVVDASLGGIGGCPFAPNATGNVPTEDVAYLLDRMGYDTGIDLASLIVGGGLDAVRLAARSHDAGTAVASGAVPGLSDTRILSPGGRLGARWIDGRCCVVGCWASAASPRPGCWAVPRCRARCRRTTWAPGTAAWPRACTPRRGGAVDPVRSGGALAAAVDLRWEVAADPGFDRWSQPARPRRPSDTDGCVKVLVDGLGPARPLLVPLRRRRADQPRRSDPDAARPRERPPSSVRLAVASCQSWSAGYYPAWRAIAAEDLDAVVFLGDYIYESRAAATGR